MSLEIIGVIGSVFFVLCGVLIGYIIWGTEGVNIEHDVWEDDKTKTD